jgi:hypothetical protein
MSGNPRFPWSTNHERERVRRTGRFLVMSSSLKSWKAAELRQLAMKFRHQAHQTGLPKYVELLCHTAEDLEAEAAVLDTYNAPRLGQHVELYV